MFSRLEVISQKHERLMTQLSVNLERIEISQRLLSLNKEKMNLLRQRMHEIRKIQPLSDNVLEQHYELQWSK
uniref:Uncharacterized protein n=2 Tax=Paenibacillus athensensis TaxID=1967502 RepID=A0A4Y8PR69_9BACL